MSKRMLSSRVLMNAASVLTPCASETSDLRPINSWAIVLLLSTAGACALTASVATGSLRCRTLFTGQGDLM